MSDHLARARLLLAQSRPADAEQEAMRALSAQPDDPGALALLALSRSDQKKGEPALEAAQRAIGLGPGEAYLHYVHALVLHRLDRNREALEAAQEALRLDPEDPDHHALLASICLARRDWRHALAAAEQALALNAEHVGAINLRAIALVRLGRKDEATETVDFALQRAPENAFSHANQGWNYLHKNDPRKAQEHFREALRLEPDLEYARDGMLEALKARNPVYRVMLAYFLWMGRLSGKLQWVFLIGVWFGGSFLRTQVRNQPQLAWLWWSLIGLLYAFIYLSWTARPMFNLLLRFNRFGRHVLSRDQRIASSWFGVAFGAALACLVVWRWRQSDFALLGMVYLAVISICLAATFNRSGRARNILATTTAALATLAGISMGLIFANRELGLTLTGWFVPGFVGFQILANVVRDR